MAKKKAATLADKLRAAREAAGLTKTDAAEKAGVGQSYWSRLEAGERDPVAVFIEQRDQLERIATAVGLTLEDLTG